MPPTLHADLSQFDLSQVVAGPDAIEAINPQRGHMRQLDRIIWHSDDHTMALGAKDVRDDEFWVDGHIPGRPLLPGVLMIEAAAQLAAWMMHNRRPDVGFVGFTACDDVKFRSQVTPGHTLLLLGKEVQCKPRRFICSAQGVVDDTLVFEARITGMPI